MTLLSPQPLSADATFSDVMPELARRGAQLFLDTLGNLDAAKTDALPQRGRRTRAPKLQRVNCYADFEKRTATELEAFHRAFSHQRNIWTHVRRAKYLDEISLFGLFLPLIAMPVELQESGDAMWSEGANALVVRCAEDSLLGVTALQRQSRSTKPARDWFRGAAKGSSTVRFVTGAAWSPPRLDQV